MNKGIIKIFNYSLPAATGVGVFSNVPPCLMVFEGALSPLGFNILIFLQYQWLSSSSVATIFLQTWIKYFIQAFSALE